MSHDVLSSANPLSAIAVTCLRLYVFMLEMAVPGNTLTAYYLLYLVKFYTLQLEVTSNSNMCIKYHSYSPTMHSILLVLLLLIFTVPSAPPSSVMVTDVTSTTITVQWGPVPCIHQNGAITGYSVRYGEIGETLTTINVTGASAMQTISNLVPSTNYSIEVAAGNSAGTGNYSGPVFSETDGIGYIHVKTHLCVVSSAEKSVLVSVNLSSTNSLTISWTLLNGVTATTFTISYSNTNTDCFTNSSTISDIAGSETMYTLTGLEEGTEYSITVTATLTGGGETEQDTITATTMAAGESTSQSSLSLLFSTSHTHSSICPSLFCESDWCDLNHHHCSMGASGTLC